MLKCGMATRFRQYYVFFRPGAAGFRLLDTEMNQLPETVRLDKWLWATRFFKTRTLATDTVSAGKVQVDGARAKPSRQVSVGQHLLIKKGPYEYEVQIERLIERRVGAPDAATAYTESAASVKKRRELELKLKDDRMVSKGERLAGRPNKRDRRQIHKFKSQDS